MNLAFGHLMLLSALWPIRAAAQECTQPQALTPVEASSQETQTSQTVKPRQSTPAVSYVDYTDCILKARAALGLKDVTPEADILAPEP